MRWIIVALAACSSASAPIANASGPAPAPAIQTPCPDMPLPPGWTLMPWAHELFPGCSPPPFVYAFSVCSGDCPRPCRVVAHNGSETDVWRYTYDARGRWLSSTSDGAAELYTGSCRYDGNVLAACGELTMRRDAAGRLVGIGGHGPEIKITWTGDKVTRIDAGDAFWVYRYDAGRLVDSTSTRYGTEREHSRWRYRNDGRVREQIDGNVHTTYDYDSRGRLVRVDVEGPDDPVYGHIYHRFALTYDAADRLIRETDTESPSLGSDAPAVVPRDYEYTCP